MSLARDRYLHHYRCHPLWSDDSVREWTEWDEKLDRLWKEQAVDPETVAELDALIKSFKCVTNKPYTFST